MKLQTSTGHPSRRAVSRFIRASLVGCVLLLAAGVIAVAAAGMHPAPLAALAGGVACLCGVLVIVFHGVGRWGNNPEYSLAGRGLAAVIALTAAAGVLVFWSTSL
ncbi:hypothetical protein [Arthrobacter koreensis]|uniref:hypothetical protein n=1 Tax=Arthrobacter TaxID=1663 RepID=UPI002DBFD7C1|nr:hypothetical protein [Arthrobacter koreensis]MEB7448755.1 hypothetical protein [Arthrobacter koreensis]